MMRSKAPLTPKLKSMTRAIEHWLELDETALRRLFDFPPVSLLNKSQDRNRPNNGADASALSTLIGMRVLPESYVPMRLFLDTNTQQAVADHGEAIFEITQYAPYGRSGAGQDDICALQGIFAVASRAHFEFVVSANSLAEAAASHDSQHLNFCQEVFAHWSDCRLSNPEPVHGGYPQGLRPLDDGRCGYLSAADHKLVRDAVMNRCDTFLTLERRLPRNAEHLSRVVGIEVMRPPELWAYLRPHLVAL